MYFFNVFVYLLFLHLLAWLDSAAMIAVYTDNNTKAKERVGETRQIQLSLWWRGAGNLVFVDVFVTVFHMVFVFVFPEKQKKAGQVCEKTTLTRQIQLSLWWRLKRSRIFLFLWLDFLFVTLYFNSIVFVFQLCWYLYFIFFVFVFPQNQKKAGQVRGDHVSKTDSII